MKSIAWSKGQRSNIFVVTWVFIWNFVTYTALNYQSVQAETEEHGIEEFKRIKQIRVRFLRK